MQIFTEKRADSSEEIFVVFIFADAGPSGHTRYPSQLMAMPHMQNGTERQSEEAKPVQQRPDLPFVWRLSKLQRYQDCRHGRETSALDSALLISTLTTVEHLMDSLVFCIVAS